MKNKIILILIGFSFYFSGFSQKTKEYFIVKHDTTGKNKYAFFFINEKGDTIKRFDTSKYNFCWTDTFQHFAVVSIKHKAGWWAIDKNEKQLFQVFNIYVGEPEADKLIEGMIRIVNNKGKIGFANFKGEIVIKPQFETVSCFYKGNAIIGEKCKEMPCCGEKKDDGEHHIIQCEKYGYINRKGQKFHLNKKTFEEVQKVIKWEWIYTE